MTRFLKKLKLMLNYVYSIIFDLILQCFISPTELNNSHISFSSHPGQVSERQRSVCRMECFPPVNVNEFGGVIFPEFLPLWILYPQSLCYRNPVSGSDVNIPQRDGLYVTWNVRKDKVLSEGGQTRMILNSNSNKTAKREKTHLVQSSPSPKRM